MMKTFGGLLLLLGTGAAIAAVMLLFSLRRVMRRSEIEPEDAFLVSACLLAAILMACFWCLAGLAIAKAPSAMSRWLVYPAWFSVLIVASLAIFVALLEPLNRVALLVPAVSCLVFSMVIGWSTTRTRRTG